MALYPCNYNCAELPAHEQVECGQYKHGGYNGVAIIECDHTIDDWSDPAQWLANIASGKVKIIGPVRANIPDGSPVEVENPNACGADTIVDTFNQTAVWSDYNVTAANVDFYNALNRRTTNLVLVNCMDGDITVVEAQVAYVATNMGPGTKNELRKFTVTAKWNEFNMPALYDAPEGIFVFGD